jgi:hypothetical protein
MRLQEFNESSDLVNLWICGDPVTTGTIPCSCNPSHEWVVYSTALAEGWLMLQCVECGLMGTIEEPSLEEWRQAFHAPSRPYPWLDAGRVVHKQIAPFRVIRAIDSPPCPCPRETELPEKRGYERVPGGIWEHNDVLTNEVKVELIELADFVAGSELCSRLLPIFIRSFEVDSGIRHSEAMHLIINRIEKFDLKGLHCSPAVVAKIIRDFAEYQAP